MTVTVRLMTTPIIGSGAAAFLSFLTSVGNGAGTGAEWAGCIASTRTPKQAPLNRNRILSPVRPWPSENIIAFTHPILCKALHPKHRNIETSALTRYTFKTECVRESNDREGTSSRHQIHGLSP